ncbi:Protein of unknown function [Pyronema omphalodes CBS 100304]|uniref:Uncharacterized protein n=1 Tax=Pyronema omphalodes (strain CBS 100304) TaxID=1076935 RepID=U4LI14_PYROM|nr:Protein of unknown function [Pyronema omphalodes CBS 100304]
MPIQSSRSANKPRLELSELYQHSLQLHMMTQTTSGAPQRCLSFIGRRMAVLVGKQVFGVHGNLAASKSLGHLQRDVNSLNFWRVTHSFIRLYLDSFSRFLGSIGVSAVFRVTRVSEFDSFVKLGCCSQVLSFRVTFFNQSYF